MTAAPFASDLPTAFIGAFLITAVLACATVAAVVAPRWRARRDGGAS